jgi:hypothetical protein
VGKSPNKFDSAERMRSGAAWPRTYLRWYRCTNRGDPHGRSISATWSRVRMRAYIFIALSRL